MKAVKIGIILLGCRHRLWIPFNPELKGIDCPHCPTHRRQRIGWMPGHVRVT